MRTVDICLYGAALGLFVCAAYALAWRTEVDKALFFIALGLLAWVLVPLIALASA